MNRGVFGWKGVPHRGWGLWVLALAWLLSSCSQESNSIVSKAWHNTTARYNAYFLAKEKMKEVEAGLVKNHTDNYNRILEIYPVVKKDQENGLTAPLTEAVKKASIPIQRHKNSDWVDDSYLVIGKARYYKTEDYDNAIHTFKYNNTKSKDVNMRHLSLIWLMRTYIKGEEFTNAYIALDYLRKQPMTRANRREFYAARAWLHYKQKEYKACADYLEEATKLMWWPTDRRSRYHFIIGQIRQREKKDSAANYHYKKCIAGNPVYEMGFYAKLNSAQVTSLSNSKDVARINKYFRQLLKDLKNEEYKDKIYYEMARFELKQNHVAKAEELYKKSLSVSKNPNQKSYTYLGLAELHYEKTRKYIESKLYYDSTVAILDTADENYIAIVKRKKVLEEFVEHYKVVQKEDSLQRLARMDSTKLLAKIDKMIAEDERKAAEAEKLAAKQARKEKLASMFGTSEAGDGTSSMQFNPTGSNPTAAAGATWYFYNPAAVSTGRAAFTRRWGRRPLEDDWRRSGKEVNFDNGNKSADSTAKTPEALAAEAEKSAEGNKESAEKPGEKGEKSAGDKSAPTKAPEKVLSPKEKRQKYLKDLPFTDEQLKASNERLRPALFYLGKIYDLKLDEYALAEQTLENLITNHAEYDKVPEAMYLLYTMFERTGQTAKRDKWRDRILAEHPESLYAKLIRNPNYLVESKAANDAVKVLYANAYGLYKEEKFVEAQIAITAILDQYPDNAYLDKLAMLQVLIQGRTLPFEDYKTALLTWQTKYPKSPLQDFSKNLITNGEAYIKRSAAKTPAAGGGGKDSLGNAKQDSVMGVPSAPVAPVAVKTRYSTSLEGPHMFLAVVPVGRLVEKELEAAIADWNKVFYPEDVFTVKNLLLGDDKHFIVYVRELKNKLQALNYLKRQQDPANSAFKEAWKTEPNIKMFVLSLDNFRLFYNAKNIPEYEAFFNKNYDLSLFK